VDTTALAVTTEEVELETMAVDLAELETNVTAADEVAEATGAAAAEPVTPTTALLLMATADWVATWVAPLITDGPGMT